MTTVLTIINIAIMLLFILGLFWMQKKHVSFSKRVFTALGIGIVFGIVLQWIYGVSSEVILKTTDWFNIIGGGYVKLLQMIVMPLVFISILSAFTKLKLKSNIGKISGLIIGILVGTTAIAAAVGIAASSVFGLEAVEIQQGEAETARAQELEGKLGEIQDKTMPQKIVELLPANPFYWCTSNFNYCDRHFCGDHWNSVSWS
jgi:L-cystine uptake protein TcyP (sodium:dicarboxylate symporter family)